jgi:penicillin-binding protein 2
MIEVPQNIPDYTRLKVLVCVVLALFSIIVIRLWYLQIVMERAYAEESKILRQRRIRRVAARGKILDAKGRILATNRSHFVVSVLPDEFSKFPEALPRLAELLEMTPEELKSEIAEGKTTPFDPVPVMRDAEMPLISKIEENKNDLPGVLIMRDPKREYKDGTLCTHLLGIARPISREKLETLKDKGYGISDYIGVEGIEAFYEDDLRGTDGGQLIEVNARGRMQNVIGEDKALPGHTLKLTVDLDLQRVAFEGLKAQLAKGHAGAAVAIDVNDGAILALASTPSYDLNSYGKDYGKLNSDRKFRPLINRAVHSAYPCGSTFKLVTAIAGLQSGTLTRYSRHYCVGRIRRGRIFNCDVRSGHGSLDLPRAIGASCNVYFWETAEDTGHESLEKWAHIMGFGEHTQVDLPRSVDNVGTVPNLAFKRKIGMGDQWYLGDTLNMAIGQGFVRVTPLQLACMTAAIANGGNLLRPQLVREVSEMRDGKPVVVRTLKREVRRTIPWEAETRAAVIAGMEKAFQRGGTVNGVTVPGISLAGKTGTVQAGGNRKDHSAFVCFAPVENPKIAVAVFVENAGFGRAAAAPIARSMLMQYFGKNTVKAQTDDDKPARTPRRRSRRGR